MKFNFNSELSRDKGVLLFVCDKNEPMHRYLTNLDKKNTNYIKQAMKVVNFNYKENNKLDLILPKGSKSDRIIILGINKNFYYNILRISLVKLNYFSNIDFICVVFILKSLKIQLKKVNFKFQTLNKF